MGCSTENSAFQVTRNPWDRERMPGGSSAAAARRPSPPCMAPLALGSDTGGSVRQPASLCGVVGLKPSYGRVSRYGLIAFGSSLDQVGPLAHDVTDAALLLEVIAGHDPRDAPASIDAGAGVPRRRLDEPLKPLTIGVPREYFGEGLDAEVEQAVREALRVYEELGAKMREVSLPNSPYALATYYLVAHGGGVEQPGPLRRRPLRPPRRAVRGAGRHVRRGRATRASAPRSSGGSCSARYALSSGYRDAYYLKALKVRRLIRDDFDRGLRECDVIAGPTSPTVAFRIGEKTDDPLAMYLADVYTISANLAGLPGVSVPCGFSEAGLPIGLQLLAAPFEEEKLLRVARMYERATDWHTRRPVL